MTRTAVDDTLAREASGGDERAFARIFNAYHQPLYRYCLSILGSPQDAEDALQETMVKVLRALPGEKREVALKPWLYRIAHNESIDLLRRRRESIPIEESDSASAAGLAEHVETRQRLRQLIADLGNLPERQRGALLMREAAGLDFEEIAAALATTPAVARQTLYEARLGLGEMQAGRDMECGAVSKVLSDGDRRVLRRRDIRAHLRGCVDCRHFAEEIESRRHDLAVISPLPALAAAAILRGLFSGGGAGAAAVGGTGATGTSGGLGGLIGGGAAKSIGGATLLKGAATFAVVAAIGVGAADKGGLIHFGQHQPPPTSQSGGGTGGQVLPRDETPSSSGAAGETSPGHADSSAPSPSHGSAATKRRRLVGPARAVSETPTEGIPVGGTEEAPEEPVAGQSIAASPSAGKSGVQQPPGHDHVKATHVESTPPAAVGGQESASTEAESNPVEPPATTHPVHPIHPSHPATPRKPKKPPKAEKPPEGEKPEKPAKVEKPPKAEEPPKAEKPTKVETPEAAAPAEVEEPADEPPGKESK